MNIYLDVDGVLLANDRRAANGADEFLQVVLTKYPDSTYWLTTHCWRGVNRAPRTLAPVLMPETVHLLNKIKPTDWNELKTDAIDFSKPFLWFDDDLFDDEREVLRTHNAEQNHILVDLYKNPNHLAELQKLL